MYTRCQEFALNVWGFQRERGTRMCLKFICWQF
jgi:hypothetical protein